MLTAGTVAKGDVTGNPMEALHPITLPAYPFGSWEPVTFLVNFQDFLSASPNLHIDSGSGR